VNVAVVAQAGQHVSMPTDANGFSRVVGPPDELERTGMNWLLGANTGTPAAQRPAVRWLTSLVVSGGWS